VAAQHVKDMLDHAAEEGRVREARRDVSTVLLTANFCAHRPGAAFYSIVS